MKNILTNHTPYRYQNDLLFSAVELAGYSWQADKFRKAVGKNSRRMAAEGLLRHRGERADRAFAESFEII